MIEKIPDQLSLQICEWGGTTFDIIPKETFSMACRKINEVIDAVNGILDYAPLEMAQNIDFAQPEVKENFTTDTYAEQRKWIGRLCRFRQGLGAATTYGILSAISPDNELPYYKEDTDTYWKHCEPVLPTDSIIYKGGDNE